MVSWWKVSAGFTWLGHRWATGRRPNPMIGTNFVFGLKVNWWLFFVFAPVMEDSFGGGSGRLGCPPKFSSHTKPGYSRDDSLFFCFWSGPSLFDTLLPWLFRRRRQSGSGGQNCPNFFTLLNNCFDWPTLYCHCSIYTVHKKKKWKKNVIASFPCVTAMWLHICLKLFKFLQIFHRFSTFCRS